MLHSPRILFVDAYDSFSNNIISLLETELGVNVVKIFIDTQIDNLPAFLKSFHAVVCGPGPGHPSEEGDVGLFTSIWALADEDVLPVLGICLGFQSLALYFGGKVCQLERPRHGLVTSIYSSGSSIFSGIPYARAVQYHSLHVVLEHGAASTTTEKLWEPTERVPDLLPLAWDIPDHQHAIEHTNPAAILMSVKHSSKPFYGVQFHPESICSHESARVIVKNWWQEAQDWWKCSTLKQCQLIQEPYGYNSKQLYAPASATSTASSPQRSSSPVSTAPSTVSSTPSHLYLMSQDLGNLTVQRICELLHVTDGEVVVLDSELRPMKDLGESSIIGIVEENTTKISYSVGANYVTIESGGSSHHGDLRGHGGNVFSYLKDFLADRAITERPESAFCGGLMGYVTYEASLETIDISTPPKSSRPDICFAFVERSIVLDHVRQKVYIQSLKEEDHSPNSWVTKTANILAAAAPEKSTAISPTLIPGSTKETYQWKIPSRDEYCAKISTCQQKIRAGESYELCLTDQTSISIDNVKGDQRHPWQRYTTQRQLNRAPFAAYLRLGSLTLLSTSPERFLRWSRPAIDPEEGPYHQLGIATTCQFRPIKGTVKKWETSEDGSPRKVTLEEATAILSTDKERAENLMIVDLIRHDLHGVAGSGNVSVPALMVIEEYETVYQLVSVIEGRLSSPLLVELPLPTTIEISSSHPAHDDLGDELFADKQRHPTGIDVLAAALPPGSMTGAPKRRACRLLRDIEQRRCRSVYSGVVGYMCVTGKGDFSVVIRSAYRWDDETVISDEGSSEMWYIGAGGAITDLSTELGEWEEMLTKLQGTLHSFAPGMSANVFA